MIYCSIQSGADEHNMLFDEFTLQHSTWTIKSCKNFEMKDRHDRFICSLVYALKAKTGPAHIIALDYALFVVELYSSSDIFS